MDLRRLLLWRLRLALATGRGRGARARVLELVVGSVVAASLGLLAWAWTRGLVEDPAAAAWLPVLVTGVVHSAFVLSLLRDTAAALGHLFLSPDGDLLLASPLRPAAIVGLKGVEALADAASSPVAIALPVLLGFGLGVGAPALYFLAAPLVLVLLLALSVGAGFLLALVLAPVVPAGQVRQWLRIAVGAFSVAVWLLLLWWSTSPNPARWSAWMSGAGTVARGPGALSAAGPGSALPSGWAGAALVALARRGDPSASLGYLGGLVLAAALAVGLAARSYPVAWQRAQVLNRKLLRVRSRPRSERSGPAFEPGLHPARASAGPVAGLALAPVFARRDARLVGRDPNLLWDMGLLLVTSSVLPVAVAPMLSRHLQWVALPAVLFFAAELGYDLGSRAFPLERRASSWVLAAPLSPGALLAARAAPAWAAGTALIALVGMAAAIGLSLARATALAALGAGWVLFTTTLAAGLAAGVYLGRADWRHPRQMLNLGGRLLLVAILMLLSVGLVLSLSAAGEPGGLRLDARAAGGWGAAAAALVTAVSLWAALRRLRRFEGLG